MSIEETHSFDVGRLVVYARLSSTDGSVDNVSTQLNIRAAGGILVASVKDDNATITSSPYLVSFDTNVERKGFTATILVFENDQLIAKKSFTQCASLCALANSNHTINNVGVPAYFNASKSHGDEHISTYAWDFGDNESEVGKVVSHLYSHYNWSGGRYMPFTASLVVMDDAGTTNSTTLPVSVYMAGDANGDGVVNILDASLVGLNWNRRA